jgi:hypothetical protein
LPACLEPGLAQELLRPRERGGGRMPARTWAAFPQMQAFLTLLRLGTHPRYGELPRAAGGWAHAADVGRVLGVTPAYVLAMHRSASGHDGDGSAGLGPLGPWCEAGDADRGPWLRARSGRWPATAGGRPPPPATSPPISGCWPRLRGAPWPPGGGAAARAAAAGAAPVEATRGRAAAEEVTEPALPEVD